MVRVRHLAAALCLLSAPALAQSTPNVFTGQIPTAAQWNSYFGAKTDVTGGTINNGVLNSVTINGSLGGSPTVGGVWTASNATLSGFAITGGTTSANASAATSTALGSTTARTLAQRAAGCDTGGANCALVDVKDFGASTSNTAAQNTTAFQAAVTRACALAPAVIQIPAGSYNVDVSGTPPFNITCSSVSVKGAGAQATIFFPTGAGDTFAVTSATPFVGFDVLSGFRVFTNANPSSGAAVHLKNTQSVILEDVRTDGTFYGAWVESSLNIQMVNVFSGGNNSTASSALWNFDRASGQGNNSTIVIVNGSATAQTPGASTYTYGMILSNADGITLTNTHIGFTQDAAIFIHPVNTNDPIDNFVLSNVDLDTAGYGLRCSQPGGYVANMGQWLFTATMAELMTNDGLSFGCAALNDVTVLGMNFLRNGTNGLNISAGTRFKFQGAIFHGSNEKNGGGAHALISAGTDINLDGSSYATFTHAVGYNIDLTGTAAGVSARNSYFAGAATGDVNLGSATNVSVSAISTDQAAYPSTATLGTQTIGASPAAGGNAAPAFQAEINSAGSDSATLLLTNSRAFSRSSGVAFQGSTTADGHAFTGAHVVSGFSGTSATSAFVTLGSGSGPNTYNDEMTISNNLVSLGAASHAAVHLATGQTTAPALTSCGTSPSIIGTDAAGIVTMGTTATGCVITFNAAYTAAPFCVVSWIATPLASQSYATSNAAITTTQTSTSNNKLQYVCMAQAGG